jgi:carbon storage regulator CsrA
MLVLSRKVGSRIVIDGNIEVSVVRLRGNRVFLGVTAPDDISIARLDSDAPAVFGENGAGGYVNGGRSLENRGER